MQKSHKGVLPVGGIRKEDGRAHCLCQRASLFIEYSAEGPSVEKTLGRSNKVAIVVCGGNNISVDMLTAFRKAMLGEENMPENIISHAARRGPTKVAA